MIYLVNVFCFFVFIFHAAFAFAGANCDAACTFYKLFQLQTENIRDYSLEGLRSKYQAIFGDIVSVINVGHELDESSDDPRICYYIEVSYAKGAKIVFLSSLDDRHFSPDFHSAELLHIEYAGKERLLPLGIMIGDNKSKITEIFGQNCTYKKFNGDYPERGEDMEIIMFGCDAIEVSCFFKENRLVKITWELNDFSSD